MASATDATSTPRKPSIKGSPAGWAISQIAAEHPTKPAAQRIRFIAVSASVKRVTHFSAGLGGVLRPQIGAEILHPGVVNHCHHRSARHQPEGGGNIGSGGETSEDA